MLLAGDLFDSASAYRDTAESLSAAAGANAAQVYIAPATTTGTARQSVPDGAVPDNVHIFTQPHLEAMAWPEKRWYSTRGLLTASEQSAGFLSGFAAPKDGNLHIACSTGKIDPAEARYDPIWKEEIAASGLAYLALGISTSGQSR